MHKKAAVFIITLLMLAAIPAFARMDDDVPRITVQELKARLDRRENITVVDVRSRGSYERSKVKIKGAVRIPPDELNERASELPMGSELVFY